jgi:hypothetical protein
MNCKPGDRCLVVRNSTGHPCRDAAVGRYVVVVRQLALAEIVYGELTPVWTYDGEAKPCPLSIFCAIRYWPDDDLKPLPPER